MAERGQAEGGHERQARINQERMEQRELMLKQFQQLRLTTEDRFQEAHILEDVQLTHREKIHRVRIQPLLEKLLRSSLEIRRNVVQEAEEARRLRKQREERVHQCRISSLGNAPDVAVREKKFRIAAMIELLNNGGYDVTFNDGRRVDVGWRVRGNMKSLFNHRRVKWRGKDLDQGWTEDDLFDEIKGMVHAYDDYLDDLVEERMDREARLKQMEAEMVDKDNEILEMKEQLDQKEEELHGKNAEIQALQKELLSLERKRSRSSRGRSSVGGLGVGGSGTDEDSDVESDNESKLINELEAGRDRLQIELRNAYSDLQAVRAQKEKADQSLIDIQPFILRLHVYRFPDGSPEIVNAWTQVLIAAHEANPKRYKLAKFNDRKGVTFADVFDLMPFLPTRSFNVPIVLATLGVYPNDTVGNEELCGQLAWLNTVLDNIDQLTGTEQNAALWRFLSAVIGRKLKGMAASLRSIAVSNLGRRSDILSFYLTKLNNAVNEVQESYRWETWTVLEKITHIWLMATHGVLADWMEATDARAKTLWEQMHPGRCSDFIDILEKCVDYVQTLRDTAIIVLESNERESTDKMVILRSKNAANQWLDYTWVRHQDRVFFTERELSLRLEVVGQSQIWSVKSPIAKPWFAVKKENGLRYLDTVYRTRMVEEVTRFVDEDTTQVTLD